MLIVIDPESSDTIHEQLLTQLRRIIACGDVKQGDRLPAARRLAESLDINVHTVLKAYKQLRNDGLVDMRRGCGATVIAQPSTVNVARAASALLHAGKQAGMTLAQLHEALDHAANSTKGATS